MVAIQTILHPNDLSESARPALALALRLARDHGARLIVLHVLDPPMIYGEVGLATSLPEVESTLLDEHRRKLEELVAGSGAELRVVEGAAEAEILRQARETSCDLIVIGTHGRGGIVRVLMGSVAVDILRKAPCPVLVAKPNATTLHPDDTSRPLFPVILYPTDFSEHSRDTFDLACALARGGARLIVLHVVEVVHIASEDFEELLNERLREFRPDDPAIAVEYRIREGEPADEILQEAAESSCELIAIGTHGRTGFVWFRMGSVAEAVLKQARCPVLADRGPHPPHGSETRDEVDEKTSSEQEGMSREANP